MKRNYLIKFGLLLVFLFITFFAFKTNLYAANFKYSDFNWDELLKQNRNFWTSTCEDDQECIDYVLETKKDFYETLYRLLAEVENKYGYIINDNYIIATVFYKLNPDSFKDPDDSKKNNPYNIDKDESTKSKYIGGYDDSEKVSAAEYFKNEKDSLKTLVNSFIGYSSTCYGVANETPSSQTDSEGNLQKTCSSSLMQVSGDKCIVPLDGPYKGSFFDSLGLTFFGSDNLKKCTEKVVEKGYKEPYLITTSEKVVNNDFFWDFLINSTYFDKKAHLQSEFDLVLANSGYKSLEELENNAEDYEKYKDDIIDARKGIVKGIKGVIESFGENNFSTVSEEFISLSSSEYWWPIGSDNIKQENGKKMASDSPSNTNVNSNFGIRNGRPHRGVDLAGVEGKTPIIAAQDGVVITGAVGVTGTCKNGDTKCGGGFGNYVMIQHTDGNYTIYAHMYPNSVIVKSGENVKQGQVLGYVGDTGSSRGAHLHFEIRKGSSASQSAVDPLTYLKADNPRPTGSSIKNINGNGNMQTVCLTLKGSGLSNNSVAAIMTNINAESGFNNNIVGDHGTSYGLCQWHNGRWTNLKNSFPSNWQTVGAQLQFLMNELHGGYASLYNALKSGNGDVSSLTYTFCSNFERPANTVATCRNRASNSSQFLNYVNNGCK